ncbi:tetratricopeptide repeat protein [Reticulibacter mediterranei]|uniref:tetratricopeptide repeat protein n=1 Tax=Reticulibacter mediterranei TaxID=2778369 RepID=UPI001F1A2E28|nr:tetratricopeptide repeat protein [Reticulibacter mediterranei]
MPSQPGRQQALSIWEQSLGVHHPKTYETRERLRAVLSALSKPQKAADLERAHLDHTKGENEQITSQQP